MIVLRADLHVHTCYSRDNAIASLGFVAVSLPFQCLPFAIVSQGKRRERRNARAPKSWMSGGLDSGGPEPSMRTMQAQR